MNHAQAQASPLRTMSTKMRTTVAALFTVALLAMTLALAAPAQAAYHSSSKSFSSKLICQVSMFGKMAEYSKKGYNNIELVDACIKQGNRNVWHYSINATS